MKQKWFDIARKVSLLSNHPSHKMGAVIVKGNKLISMGFNQNKTHPKSTHPFKSIHAEMSAILKAKTDLSGASIYIYRETKNGTPALAKPCSWCQNMIDVANIKNVFYT